MFTRHFAHWPPGQPKTLELPRETVYANLVATAARSPQRTAIDYYGSRISYAELKRQVDVLARTRSVGRSRFVQAVERSFHPRILYPGRVCVKLRLPAKAACGISRRA